MSEQNTLAPVFFQPLPEHDNLNTAYFLARLCEKVVVTEDGCWEWSGHRNERGYGRIGGDGRRVLTVHRVVYQLCVGQTKRGYGVLHHCDNPPCCRPDHLFVGTQKDNMNDCRRKGRVAHNKAVGERNGQAKLDVEKVRYIRQRAADEGKSYALQLALSRELHVAPRTIGKVINGERWGHVQ